mgnify:CR=1 FL=1
MIGRENIEEKIFQYFEGDLPASESLELENFIKNNPEYQIDFDAWKNSVVQDDQLKYEHADELLVHERFTPKGWFKWASGGVMFFGFVFASVVLMNKFDFNNETLKILTESDYSINELYKKAKKEIRVEQIKLFNNSLPTFLKDNDEPVWLDYEDTLNVIRSVIYAIQDDHKIKDLKYVRESYNKSFKHKNDLNVRFDFYNTSYDFLYINEDLDLIDPSNKKIYVNLPELDIESVFNIKNKTHYFNEIQIDLLNAFKLYPGMGYIRSLDSEKIIHQLPNKTTRFFATRKSALLKRVAINLDHEGNAITYIRACSVAMTLLL